MSGDFNIMGLLSSILGLSSLPGIFQNQENADQLFADMINQRDLARQDPNRPALINQEFERRSNFLNGQGPLSAITGLGEDHLLNFMGNSSQGANATIQGLQSLSGLSGPPIRGLGGIDFPSHGPEAPEAPIPTPDPRGPTPPAGDPRIPNPLGPAPTDIPPREPTPFENDGPAGNGFPALSAGRLTGDGRGEPREAPGPRGPSPTPRGERLAPPPSSGPGVSAFGASDAFNTSGPNIDAFRAAQEPLPQSNLFGDTDDFNSNGGMFDFLAHRPQEAGSTTPPGAPAGTGTHNGQADGVSGSAPPGGGGGPATPDSPFLDFFNASSGAGGNTAAPAPAPSVPGIPSDPVDRLNGGRTAPFDPNLPSFAVGTPLVQNTGAANVHQGEAIIPAAQNPNNPDVKAPPSFTSTPAAPAPGGRAPTFGQPPAAPSAPTPPAPPGGRAPTFQQPAPPGAPTPTGVPHPQAPTGQRAPTFQQPPAPQGGGRAPTFQQPPAQAAPPAAAPQITSVQNAPPPPQAPQGPVVMSANGRQDPPVSSGQPYVGNSLEGLQTLANSGGPITQDIQNIQNQQVSDLGGNQQLANQRAIRENLGSRGLGESGTQDFLELQSRLGSQGNVIQGQNQVALDAAGRNFDATLGANTALGQTGLGAEQLGLQRDTLAQNLDLANRGLGLQGRGLDIQSELGQGGLAAQNRGLDIQSQLGQGGLDLQASGQDIQSQLGNRGIDAQLSGQDVQSQLGNRGLNVQRRGQDLQNELGQSGQDIQSQLGNRGLDVEGQLGNRGLDINQENVSGNLDLGQGQLDLQGQLGNRGLANDEFRADTERGLGQGNLELNQDALGNNQFNENRDFERQIGLDQFDIQSQQGQQVMNMIQQMFGMEEGQEQLSQDQLSQLQDLLGGSFPSSAPQGGRTVMAPEQRIVA